MGDLENLSALTLKPRKKTPLVLEGQESSTLCMTVLWGGTTHMSEAELQ